MLRLETQNQKLMKLTNLSNISTQIVLNSQYKWKYIIMKIIKDFKNVLHLHIVENIAVHGIYQLPISKIVLQFENQSDVLRDLNIIQQLVEYHLYLKSFCRQIFS